MFSLTGNVAAAANSSAAVDATPGADTEGHELDLLSSMEYPVVPCAYVNDGLCDEITKLQFMDDGTSFLAVISALHYLNRLRQGFAGNVPATWMMNQELTLVEFAELEERVLQPTTKIDKVLHAMKSGDENKVLDAIRMACGMEALTAYLAKVEECPMKAMLEYMCIKLRLPHITDEQLASYATARTTD